MGKQHQVALFFYMVVLFSIFVIQFSVACASLAATTEDELQIVGKGWDGYKDDVQANLDCCGWDKKFNSTGTETSKCPADCYENPDTCHICRDVMEDKIDYAVASGKNSFCPRAARSP